MIIKTNTKITEETLATAKQLYNDGYSIDEIVSIIGISISF